MPQIVDPAGMSDKIPSPNDSVNDRTINAETQGIDTSSFRPPPENESYFIQLGVFSTRENAERFVSHLKAVNIEATVTSRPGSSKTLYVVTTGDFQTREAAESTAAGFKRRSINCIVVRIGESQE